MASNIVVTDRPSLAANFAENSKQVLCQAAFGAGAFAIGGRLVGAAALTPQGSLATGAALLAGLAFCPAFADPNQILGQPPGFSGGQCLLPYKFRWTVSDPSYMGASSGLTDVTVPGPVSALEQTTSNTGPGSVQAYGVRGTSAIGPFEFPFICGTVQGASGSISLERADGGVDDCGDAPRTGGQIVSSPGGDTITNVEDNRDYSTVIPVQFSIGGDTSTINLNFGGIKIGSLFPLDFSVNIGGSDFRFKENPDGELEPAPTSPDSEAPDDKIQRLLKEIKDCVCGGNQEVSSIFLSTVDFSDGCSLRTESLQVQPGSVPPEQFERFESTAAAALSACQDGSPQQLPESAIFSASSAGMEIFSSEFGPEVISLRLKITGISENGPSLISTFPEAGQRKFGSVAYTIANSNGGGDYIYIFDEDTYIPLPKRAKSGRLRLLLKDGVAFSLFDTGERI